MTGAGTTNGRSDAPHVGRLAPLIANARRDLELLTGLPVDSVTSFRRTEEGWRITFEVVELRRIPESTSVLGTFEALADSDGAVIEFQRSGRYYKNQATDGDVT